VDRTRQRRRRRKLLDRLGMSHGGQLHKALRPAVTMAEWALGVGFVLALVAVLDLAAVGLALRGEMGGAALQRLLGTLAVVGGLTALGLAYLARFQQRLVSTRRQLVVFGACCLACVAIAKGLLALDARMAPQWRGLVYLTPLSAFVIFFAVAYGQREAIAAGIILAMLVGLATYISASQSAGAGAQSAVEALPVVAVLMSGALLAAIASHTIRKRLKLLEVGLAVGLLHAGLLLGFCLLRGRIGLDRLPPSELLWGLANGVGVGAVMTSALPLLELILNVVTDIRLLELTDQDQPLLRGLVTFAPSTDNHSRRVARLAEAAAEAIGADPLLALVGAYYHDVGKITKPEYFIENQMNGENPHDNLRPSLSSLIIASHVKDGVDLAIEAKLPRPVVDIIEQHHGTSAIEFFYDRYARQVGSRAARDAGLFRYPGPKPASKEAAIVMIADAVEAASRTLDRPLPSRIEALVKRITASRLLDGQLEESGLNLGELRLIEQAMFRVLCSMYHARVDYPANNASAPASGPRERTSR